MVGIYIPMGVYRCCCSLMNMKFLRFQMVKNKARDIRLLNIWYPTPPLELLPNGFPSGFYTTFGVRTIQKYD